MDLEIHQAKREEVYRDIVRIPEEVRMDSSGQSIEEGSVCRIKTRSKTAYVIVRGVRNFERTGCPAHVHDHCRCIHMDEVTRIKLGVENMKSANFDLTQVRWFGQLRWAWNATEIGYRISSRLGVIGLALGVIAIVVAALPELFHWIQLAK